jgi:type II secretory pathway component GspD/PulD (secretin)
MARQLAEEAYKPSYGVQEQARDLLNSIDVEEFAQKRLEADRAFLAGYDAFLKKDFRQAAKIFAQLDERMLSEQRQKTLRELAMTKEMMQATAPVAPQAPVQLTATTMPDGPGKASVGDLASQDNDIERFKAMRKIEFEMLTKDGLDAQRRALQKAETGDFDSAMDILRGFSALLADSKLDAQQVATLQRPLDRYILQFKTRKQQVLWQKEQMAALNDHGAIDREKKRIEDRRDKDNKISGLLRDYADLMKEGKYEKAYVLASQAHELDPENMAAQAAMYISNVQKQEKRNAKVENDWQDRYVHDLEADSGPLLDTDNPWTFSKRYQERAKQRKTFEKGIMSELHDPIEKQIARAVEEKKVTVSFNNTPLYQVVRDLKAVIGDDINIVFDHQALKEDGIRLDQPVTQTLNGMPLRSALNILLKDVGLKWVIQNHSITITTEAWAKGNSQMRTYSVADLVIPVENHPSPVQQYNKAKMQAAINLQLGGINGCNNPQYNMLPSGVLAAQGGQANSLAGAKVPKPEAGQTLEELLIRLITNTIAPDSWSDVGGKGTIQYYPLGLALVVNQTGDIQEQIVDLLNALRRLQDLQIAIELRLVSVAEAFYERIGVDFSMNILHGSSRFIPELLSGNFAPNGQINQFRPSNFWSGLTPAGTFTPDLGVPIATHSFDFSLPPFGGYPGTLGADGGLGVGLAFLSDIQVFMFLEAAQGDRRTNVMQAPKITVFNGQTANISVTDELVFLQQINVVQLNGQNVFQPVQVPVPVQIPAFPGLAMTVTPVVSADRRFVRLNLAPSLQNLISATVPLVPIQQVVPQLFFDNISPPQPVIFQLFFQQPSFSTITLDTTVVVPDGGTVLMGGFKSLLEGRNEFGPPVLSKIPYLSRLFKNVAYGREAQSLMIMVTARIIINEEEELEFLGQLPRIPR